MPVGGELQCWPGGITEGWTWALVVQDHAEEATVDRQPAAVVIDEAQLPELIQEVTDRDRVVPTIWARLS